MSVSERQRHALHEWAKNAASEEVAETLMDLLPPVGWADVATKRDLEQLERRLELRFDARFETLEHRFESMEHRLEGELHRQLRQHTYWIMTSLWAAVGVAVGLSQAL